MLDHLSAWENFYIIVGSSAGALTGLQFVVITLIAESPRRASAGTISAFGTPTVVHFCFVLLLGAIISAPWARLAEPAFALAMAGLAGVGYVVVTIRRTLRQTGYTPEFADWLWHIVLPMISYVTTAVAALLLPRHPTSSLFAIAGAALILLFVGIHNAWDTVTYIATNQDRT